MTLVLSLNRPRCPATPEELLLPPLRMMPEPLGKPVTLLLLIVAASMLMAPEASPVALTRMPEPFEAAMLLGLVMTLLEILAVVIVPALPSRSTPLNQALVRVFPVMVKVPEMLLPSPLPDAE